MNALSAIGINQDPLLAALTLPANASANISLTNPSTPAFLNMIHFMLDAPAIHGTALASQTSARNAASASSLTTATPAQVADAMIRSMLASPSPRTAVAQSEAQATPSEQAPTQTSSVPSAPSQPAPVVPIQQPASATTIVPQTVPSPHSVLAPNLLQLSQPKVSRPREVPNRQPEVQPDAQTNVQTDVQPEAKQPNGQLETQPFVAPVALTAENTKTATATNPESTAPIESPDAAIARPMASVPQAAQAVPPALIPTRTSNTAAPVRLAPMKASSINTVSKNSVATSEKTASPMPIEARDFVPVTPAASVVEKLTPRKQPAAAQTSPQRATPQAATPAPETLPPDEQAVAASPFSAPAIATSVKPAPPQAAESYPTPKTADTPQAPVPIAPRSLQTTVKTSTPTPNAAPATSSASQNTPQPATASPRIPADGKIAFTAILTPQKDAPNSPAPAAPKQPAEAEPLAKETPSAPVTVASAPVAPIFPAAPTPAAPAVSTTPAQNGAAQPLIQLTSGQNAQGNSDNGSSSQQQDPSGDTSDRPSPTPDAKMKTAAAKQDDRSAQTAAQNAPPIVPTSNPAASNLADSNTVGPTRAASPAPEPKASLETPFHAASDALRTSEPDAPSLAPRTAAAQEIAIRIAQPDGAPVDLRVVERAGQVHVDVRTPDAALQTSLRQDLGTLTNSLQRAGYHTETFTPAATARASAASRNENGNEDSRQDSSQNRNGAGDFSGGRRQQQQKRPSTWLEELEEQQ